MDDGMQIPEIEGFDESVEEIGFAVHEAIGDTDAGIDQAMQEAIYEFSEGSTKGAIEEALQEEGIPEENITELTEKGYGIITKAQTEQEVSAEEEIQGLKQTTGREGTPKPYNYPSVPNKKARHNIPYPSGKNTAHISNRERLEAMKEGLEEFLSQPHKTWQQEEAATEKLEEIQQQLNGLPPDPPEPEEPEIEDISDEEAQAMGYQDARERKTWLEGTESVKQIPKNVYKPAKLNTIKGIYSQGLENKGKLGYEGIGKLMDDWDEQKHDMGTMFDY